MTSTAPHLEYIWWVHWRAPIIFFIVKFNTFMLLFLMHTHAGYTTILHVHHTSLIIKTHAHTVSRKGMLFWYTCEINKIGKRWWCNVEVTRDDQKKLWPAWLYKGSPGSLLLWLMFVCCCLLLFVCCFVVVVVYFWMLLFMCWLVSCVLSVFARHTQGKTVQ